MCYIEQGYGKGGAFRGVSFLPLRATFALRYTMTTPTVHFIASLTMVPVWFSASVFGGVG